MEKIEYLKIIATIIIALFGWWITHRLNTERDFKNKKKEMKISYLIEAYMELEDVCHRYEDDIIERFPKLEAALAKIQLFGTESQISLSHEIIDSVQGGIADTDTLLKDLRKELRDELKLEQTQTDIHFFRWGMKPDENDRPS